MLTVDDMLAACIPGGSVCDPQQVADAIRAWYAEHPAAADAQGVEALLRSENPDRKDFTLDEALSIADKHEAAHRHVPSVSRTLAAEVRRLTASAAVKQSLTTDASAQQPAERERVELPDGYGVHEISDLSRWVSAPFAVVCHRDKVLVAHCTHRDSAERIAAALNGQPNVVMPLDEAIRIGNAMLAGRSAAVADGYRLVPLVQTDEMDVAFRECWYSRRRAIDDEDTQDAYSVLLSAAPPPPAAQTTEIPDVAFELRDILVAASSRIANGEHDRAQKYIGEALQHLNDFQVVTAAQPIAHGDSERSAFEMIEEQEKRATDRAKAKQEGSDA